nr:MAG TPA: hypothetical protein [Caudoviricetes sp.]
MCYCLAQFNNLHALSQVQKPKGPNTYTCAAILE